MQHLAQKKGSQKLDELFKMSDIKGGLESLRSFAQVVFFSGVKIGASIKLAYRAATAENNKKINTAVELYKREVEKSNNKITTELRALGADEIDLDTMLISPALFWLTAFPNIARWAKIRSGEKDIPGWVREYIMSIENNTDASTPLSKRIRRYFTKDSLRYDEARSLNAIELLLLEARTQKISDPKIAIEALKALGFNGIDAWISARYKSWNNLLAALEASIKVTSDTAEALRNVKSIDDLVELSLAKNLSFIITDDVVRDLSDQKNYKKKGMTPDIAAQQYAKNLGETLMAAALNSAADKVQKLIEQRILPSTNKLLGSVGVTDAAKEIALKIERLIGKE